MKKRAHFIGFDDLVDNHEMLPFVRRSVSNHTYTPQSHENLIKSYSKTKGRESDSKYHKVENKKLKTELKRVNEEARRNREEVERLRSELSKGNSNTVDYGTEAGYTRDTLSSHFSEVMRRYHSTLADKDRQIRLLQEKLTQYENRQQQPHTSVEAERLRRTNAAIQVFRRDVDLVKTQLERSPLDKIPCTSSRDRAVVAELRRRQRFGVVADLEAMGKKFFQRLEFEEKLDKLHWGLESRRQLEHELSSGGECAPTCTYREEFQMLETTRNNLLKALRDLKAASTPQPQQLQSPVSITAIQTLYRAPAHIAQSHGSVRELLDK